MQADQTKAEKKAELVDVAITVVQELGLKKTTVDDIAEAAGMAPTSLYYYFSSKKELLRAVLAALGERLLSQAEAAIAAAETPENKLIALWKALLVAVRKSALWFDLRSGEGSLSKRLAGDAFREFDNKHRELVRTILSDGIHQGVFEVANLDLTVLVLSKGFTGLASSLAEDSEAEFVLVEESFEELSGLLMNGIKAR